MAGVENKVDKNIKWFYLLTSFVINWSSTKIFKVLKIFKSELIET